MIERSADNVCFFYSLHGPSYEHVSFATDHTDCVGHLSASQSVTLSDIPLRNWVFRRSWRKLRLHDASRLSNDTLYSRNFRRLRHDVHGLRPSRLRYFRNVGVSGREHGGIPSSIYISNTLYATSEKLYFQTGCFRDDVTSGRENQILRGGGGVFTICRYFRSKTKISGPEVEDLQRWMAGSGWTFLSRARLESLGSVASVDERSAMNEGQTKGRDETYDRIVECIKIHREAVEWVEHHSVIYFFREDPSLI